MGRRALGRTADLGERQGQQAASIPLPPTVRELLWPLQGEHPSAVFTYIVRHPSRDARRGERRPIAYEGLTSEWARSVARAGLTDLHFHDLRHTAATRVLRATGNLNVVRRMLRHDDIASTMRYAHSQQDDVLAGMEAAGAQTVPTKGPHINQTEQVKV